MIASRAIAMGAGAMLAGCLQGGPYACLDEAQCMRPGSDEGECVEGWCAYPDEVCGGLRYSPNAGDGLAGLCVDQAATDGETESGESTEPTSSVPVSTGNDDDTCGGPCESPPGECFASTGVCDDGTCLYGPRMEGTACEDGDACTSSECDGAGNCIVTAMVACEDPPSDCYDPIGECDADDGTCSYAPFGAGTNCEDGSTCTEGDQCDGDGTCIAGESCPTDNPCVTPSCEDDACVFPPVADGTSCGAVSAARCCGGTCVDITSDVNNCGACGAACEPGHGCESVATTPDCELAPADTSGRCTCFGNIDCDPGYVCRTQAPYTNLCTPEDAAACPGTFVEVNFCPNYCEYP